MLPQSDPNLDLLLKQFSSLDNLVQVIVVVALLAIPITIVNGVFGLVRSLIHAITIALRGYPPAHCDAEGKFVSQENNDDDDDEDETSS